MESHSQHLGCTKHKGTWQWQCQWHVLNYNRSGAYFSYGLRSIKHMQITTGIKFTLESGVATVEPAVLV
eukprot:jgi/Botrbrau1/13408/Bobra.0082s0015.1